MFHRLPGCGSVETDQSGRPIRSIGVARFGTGLGIAIWSAISVLVLIGLAGCSADRTAQQRVAGPALWLTPDDPLDISRTVATALPRLEVIYLDGGTIGRDGAIVRAERFARTPAGLPVHVVLRGQLLPSMPERWAETLASSLGGLRLDLQNRGQEMAGVLLWLDELTLEDAEADVLRDVRGELDQDLAVGLYLPDTVTPDRASETAGELFDFAVTEFYGQPWDAPDDANRWEITRGQPRLQDLSGGGVALRVIVRGAGRLSSGVTALGPRLPRSAIAERVDSVDNSFQFEGYDRQMFSLEVSPGLEIPGLGRVPRSVTLHVARPTAQHLARVTAAIEAMAPGETPASEFGPQIIYADFVPEPDGISVSWRQLPEIFEGEGLAPELTLEVDATGGARELVIALRNTGGPTAVGQLRHNYVEIAVTDGAIRAVAPGEFVRYSLGGDEPSSRSEMRLGSARIARLSMPLLEAETAITSGRVRVLGTRPRVEVRASFLDPLGDVVAVDGSPWTWPPQSTESDSS